MSECMGWYINIVKIEHAANIFHHQKYTKSIQLVPYYLAEIVSFAKFFSSSHSIQQRSTLLKKNKNNTVTLLKLNVF